jgi:2-polyprenyl-3-methyl-5-hydroxy-6-metoxy-1,4-benzoquinol methylase
VVRKLRRFYTSEQRAELYSKVFDPARWPEHVERIERTIRIIQSYVVDEMDGDSGIVVDLSCGDGSIAHTLRTTSRHVHAVDLTDGPDMLDTLRAWNEEPADLFICTETIEHLEAPWTALELIAQHTRHLVLSTPLDEPDQGNWEHYWSFSLRDVYDLLTQAGFTDLERLVLSGRGWHYNYQVWLGRTEL